MKIKEVAAALERFAPLPLQESYDNAGLQIGLTEDENASGALLCLDVTEKVLAEAVEKGCNLVVSHHPLLFRPLRNVTGRTMVGRCVALAIRNGVSIYSAHTNLDNAPGGVNFMMAERIGLANGRFLQPLKGQEGGSGLIGELPESMPAGDFLKKVAGAFGVEALMHNDWRGDEVRTVALCGGAGDFLLDEAVRQGADAFLTGEMGYHRYFGHEDEILIGVTGHYQSERFTIELLRRILARSCPELRTVVTETNTNPIITN